jgi:GxxExxY protein
MMEAEKLEYKHSGLTEVIIGCFYTVYNSVDFGFNEKAYENALAAELLKRGLAVEQQKEVEIGYNGTSIGSFVPDIVVDDTVILELKTTDNIQRSHEKQLLNYLKVTQYEVGLLLNFGPKPQIVRKAYDNENKPRLFKG